jgi:hypothetical protein
MLVLVTFGTHAELTARQTQITLSALVYPVPPSEEVTIQRVWNPRNSTIIPPYHVPSATISQSTFPRALFFDTKPCASMRLGTRDRACEPYGADIAVGVQVSARMEASGMNVVQLA